MKEENYENEVTEEILDGLEEITEEEMQETTGGAGGYGNVQFECVCGAEFLMEKGWVNHLRSSRHRSGKVYYQQAKGKGHKGTSIGTATVTYKNGKIQIKYPNGKVSTHQIQTTGVIINTPEIAGNLTDTISGASMNPITKRG